MPFYNANVNVKGSPIMSKAKALSSSKASSGASTPLKANSSNVNTTPTTTVIVNTDAKAPVAHGTSPSPLSGSGNTTPSSDEENVIPSSPPAQTEADQGTRPLSPRPLSPQLKDVRAYEHERQRAKRAGEWALKRAMKNSLSMGGSTKVKGDLTSGAGARKKAATQSGAGREDVDVEFVVGVRSKEFAGPAPVTAEVPTNSLAMAMAMAVTTPKADLSVSLSDLIKPKSKTRKNKSKLGKFGSLRRKGVEDDNDDDSYADGDEEEEEFEWVPALRAVIALDEVDPQGRRDMEVDEPWECVSGDEEEEQKGKRELSYAEVLSGMHLD
ncbi:hypothetical protein CPB84DRAFT_1310660 [Gymnopilus junonius]|uniref:Uncharacterized protein n=1 Tax=Gymnopilus junonius TaxID=109634 RepID=A0A9P5NJR5_GYMJU|nr:hypothetical protein CPB84DRAFT_1310660 [Gymnopilus junonius]